MTKSELKDLEKRLSAATGQDRELDSLIAKTFGTGSAPGSRYSSSVDDCVALIGAVLPDWFWHVGHGPRGIMPYASLHRRTASGDGSAMRVETTASTVPLALLQATVKALLLDR